MRTESEQPFSREVEAHVISACLVDGQATIARALDAGVRKESFWLPQHAVTFAAIESLYRSAPPVTLEVLVAELQHRGDLERVGGMSFLVEVTSAAPTTAHAGHFIARLLELAARRQLIRSAESEISAARDTNKPLLEILSTRRQDTAAVDRMAVSTLPPFVDISNALSKPPARPEDVVIGVLHRTCKLVLGGASKGRKTWSLLDLAISVATGSSWWGWPTRKGRVAYLNFEIPRPFFVERVGAIQRAKGIAIAAGMFHEVTLRGFARPIEDVEALLMDRLCAGDYSLVVVDPIYKLLGGRDENKAGDVAQILNGLERIAVKSGAALAFGAHYAKGDASAKVSIDRIGGSGVFARDPDAIITLTQHEEDDALAVDTTLRNHPPQDPFVLRWKFPVFVRDGNLDPAQLRRSKTKPEKFSAVELFAVFRDGMTASEWQRACGWTEGTFRRKRDDLLRQGRIKPEGNLFRIGDTAA